MMLFLAFSWLAALQLLLNFTLVILRCCARHVAVLGGGWGGVGLKTFLCTCRNQAATVKRGGWGGVGVGWDNNVIGLAFSCTSTPTSCYTDWICCYASTCSLHRWADTALCFLRGSCYASTCLGSYASIWFVLRSSNTQRSWTKDSNLWEKNEWSSTTALLLQEPNN